MKAMPPPTPYAIGDTAFLPNRQTDVVRYDPARRKSKRVDCSYAARVSSGNHDISTAARIVNMSMEGAKVEVMFPAKGPSVVLLCDYDNDTVYECEVMWRTFTHLGLSFIDILGSSRRRLYFAGREVPLKQSDRNILTLPGEPASK